MGRAKKMWIKGATQNKGGLHRALHIPQGEKIPQAKIEKAEHSSNGKLRREANLAETLEHLPRHHGPK
jgi:hypothetical protein